MGRFDTTEKAIDANIKTNGKQEITGSGLNSVLKSMLSATDSELTELSEELIDLDNLIIGEQTISAILSEAYNNIIYEFTDLKANTKYKFILNLVTPCTVLTYPRLFDASGAQLTFGSMTKGSSSFEIEYTPTSDMSKVIFRYFISGDTNLLNTTCQLTFKVESSLLNRINVIEEKIDTPSYYIDETIIL